MKMKALFILPLALLASVSCTIGTNDNIVPGIGLVDKMEWLLENAESGGNYVLEVKADESVPPYQRFEYSGRSNITVTLRGSGENRCVTLISNGNLFIVRTGVTLILDNITLRGRSFNTAPLIHVRAGGALQMNNGALITGNASTGSNGGGVWVEGTFVMNGGAFSGNTATLDGGGVVVYGTFTMSDGIIQSNKTNIDSRSGNGGGVFVRGTFNMNDGSIYANLAGSSGGGVYVNGTFNMRDGSIAGNGAFENGGGVFVGSSNTFNKTGGTITGYGNDTKSGNLIGSGSGPLNWRGHAVYVGSPDGTLKIKENTAGPGDNLFYIYSNRTATATGAWEN